jgi:hypothetical protein
MIRILRIVTLLALMMALPNVPGTHAQTGTGYELSWWTVDGGGVTPHDNSGYALGGTSGQPDAAIWSGGDYVLAGGFWGGVAVEYRIYLPLVLRGT